MIRFIIKVICKFTPKCILMRISDKQFLKMRYYAYIGKALNLDNPLTYNEKLQWLKLYDRKPEYTMMVDKYEAKKYIANVIGEEYIIPALGVWNRFEDIDFDKLPNQFVLKCSHDSGSVIICRDKETFDKTAAKSKINRCLKREFYLRTREWPYKNVRPRIIAEVYMEDTEGDALTDYKFFCFNGIAKVMYISKDRGADPRTDFFDMDFNHLPIKAKDPNADVIPPKPDSFDQMKQIAEKLSNCIPHLRVDFYLVNDRIYVGEMTFYHLSGFTKITPQEWNMRLGSWINLPADNAC